MESDVDLIITCDRLKSNNQLDFTDPAAVKQLTKTLLKLNFGLRIALPDDRLCPPVGITILLERVEIPSMFAQKTTVHDGEIVYSSLDGND